MADEKVRADEVEAADEDEARWWSERRRMAVGWRGDGMAGRCRVELLERCVEREGGEGGREERRGCRVKEERRRGEVGTAFVGSTRAQGAMQGVQTVSTGLGELARGA